MKTKANELIEKFGITIIKQGNQENLMIDTSAYGRPSAKEGSAIRSLKRDIIAEIKRQRAERKAAADAEYKVWKEKTSARISAIEGLKELRKARAAEMARHEEFSRRSEDESLSCFLQERPRVNSAELAKKYPRAAAYVEAEAFSKASHYAKIAAGKAAMERILDGEDHEKVLAEMREWNK